MSNRPISWIIGCAGLGLIALVLIQVQWMRQSRDLIEEQFNHKVNMALCNAIEDVSIAKSCCRKHVDNDIAPQASSCQIRQQPAILEKSLSEALAFYQIDLPYLMAITDKSDQNGEAEPLYACSMKPLIGDDSQYLSIHFPDKMKYVLGKMSFMLLASVLILLFITSIFIWASSTLYRQQKIAAINLDFFNNTAHEFKTPLTNILLSLRLLEKKPAEEKYASIIRQEAKGLQEQVDRFLQLAQMEDGEYKIRPERIDAANMVTQVVDRLQLMARERGGAIHFVAPEPFLPLTADPFHLGNALRNLLENAIKYSTDPPEVFVSLEVEKSRLLFHIRDRGPGISKADQERIFGKFQRLQHRHTIKGSGLGLAYVRMIARLHGGNVSLQSEPGRGSTFTVSLPNHPS
ncbi:MAG: HAMP domain-containing sensor histidine kinase [Bacteroidota bacterium]